MSDSISDTAIRKVLICLCYVLFIITNYINGYIQTERNNEYSQNTHKFRWTEFLCKQLIKIQCPRGLESVEYTIERLGDCMEYIHLRINIIICVCTYISSWFTCRHVRNYCVILYAIYDSTFRLDSLAHLVETYLKKNTFFLETFVSRHNMTILNPKYFAMST